MSSKNYCFLCLEKCSRQVCFTCTCKAHPQCWDDYQKKQIHSQICCPICRGKNILLRPRTRSKSKLTELTEIIVAVEVIQSRTDLIGRIREALNLNEELGYEDRIRNVSVIFSLFVHRCSIVFEMCSSCFQ